MDEHDHLIHVLGEIRRRGGIGSDPLERAIVHARGFVEWLEPEGSLLDLGSGGGLPGLVIAVYAPGWTITLVERRGTRADLLRFGVTALGLGDRVTVRQDDVVRIGRAGEWAGDVVSARSFAPPLTVLRVARPLLRAAGTVLCSDAPGAPVRWTPDELDRLGFSDLGSRQSIHGFARR
jgi:16S rRNA (guanine527-N7)-methyltransferase